MLFQALSRCDKLQKLKIRTFGRLEILFESLSRLEHFVELNLEHDANVTDESLFLVESRLKNLKRLNISGKKF